MEFCKLILEVVNRDDSTGSANLNLEDHQMLKIVMIQDFPKKNILNIFQ